jgi:hypothetical protein
MEKIENVAGLGFVEPVHGRYRKVQTSVHTP